MTSHHPLSILCAAALLSACVRSEPAACLDAVRTADLPAALNEASGLAVSRRNPAVLWAHNDSERAATLYALDRSGALLHAILLDGAGSQVDWEDIAAGPCPDGQCLYIGDIGDNLHDRDDRAIVRVAEPDPAAQQTARAERFPIRYPEGPVDAEALFVLPDTTVYIITKGRSGSVALYRYPPPLRARETVTLEHVQTLGDGVAQLPDQVTGADASPDGLHIAVRTYSAIRMFRLDDDTLSALHHFDLTELAEPQGEAVAFAGGDTLILATESGPAGSDPFLSTARCSVR